MQRAPNPHSPEEVRRAIQRQRADSDTQGNGLAAVNAAVVVVQSDVAALEVKVDALENATYSAEADTVIVAGQPLYVKNSGHVDLAIASDPVASEAVGFATLGALPSFSSQYVTEGKITLANWSAVSGSPLLAPGSAYYLDSATAGRITTAAPATGYVVRVGRTTSTVILDIEIEPPIRL